MSFLEYYYLFVLFLQLSLKWIQLLHLSIQLNNLTLRLMILLPHLIKIIFHLFQILLPILNLFLQKRNFLILYLQLMHLKPLFIRLFLQFHPSLSLVIQILLFVLKLYLNTFDIRVKKLDCSLWTVFNTTNFSLVLCYKFLIFKTELILKFLDFFFIFLVHLLKHSLTILNWYLIFVDSGF